MWLQKSMNMFLFSIHVWYFMDSIVERSRFDKLKQEDL